MAKLKYIGAERYIRQLVDELAEEGGRIVRNATQNHTFRNRTGNLHDSYASAVFVNGKLQRRTIRYGDDVEQSRSVRTLGNYEGERTFPNKKGERYFNGDEIETTGRDEVKHFFYNYTHNGKGIELVIIAAMFYAGWVEKSGYTVLSMAYSDLQELARKYNGELRQLDVWRDFNKIGKGAFYPPF